MQSNQGQLSELATLRFEKQRLGYDLAEIRAKLRGNNHHTGLISARVAKLARLKVIDLRLIELKAEIYSQPLPTIDLVDLVESLSKLEATIVDQGYEGGLEALRAFTQAVTSDIDRIHSLQES